MCQNLVLCNKDSEAKNILTIKQKVIVQMLCEMGRIFLASPGSFKENKASR